MRAPRVPLDPALADLFHLADLIVTESDVGARAVRRCGRDRGAEAGGPVVSMPPLVPARARAQDGTVRRDALRAMAGATSGNLLIASGGGTRAVTLRAMAIFQVFADGSYRACGGCHRVTVFASRNACERSPVPVCGTCGSTESRVGRPRPEARLFVAHGAHARTSAGPLGQWSAEDASRLLGLEGRAHVETDAGVEPRHTLAHAVPRLAAADIHLAPHDLSDLDSTVLATCALGVPTVTTRFGAAAEILAGVVRLVPPAVTIVASEGHRLAIRDIGGAVRELRELADDGEARREAMRRMDPAAVAVRWHALRGTARPTARRPSPGAGAAMAPWCVAMIAPAADQPPTGARRPPETTTRRRDQGRWRRVASAAVRLRWTGTGRVLGSRAMANIPRRELVGNYVSNIGSYAEIGIGFGDTVLRVCAALVPGSSVYLFDFDDRVETVADRIEAAHPGTLTVHRFGNTRKLRDSYCRGLLRLVARGERVFDDVYLDGAHDLVIDGFAFHLIDLLLRPRGFIELDDYGWTHGNSPTVNPRKHPPSAQLYTEEQIATPHVTLIVDHLVKRTRAIARSRRTGSIRRSREGFAASRPASSLPAAR